MLQVPPAPYEFSVNGSVLQALPSGGLFWPAEGLLVVSDLHFGKAERIARRGGTLLPPYDTEATLQKLDDDISLTCPRHVLCLGDSFDDLTAADSLTEGERLWILRLMAGRNWTWVEGNHDPGSTHIGGSHVSHLTFGPLTFRHIALPGALGEVSGHFHPKARLSGRSFPCFLADNSRVILPAYGSYTGGLWTHDPSLSALMGPSAVAILTGRKPLPIPMPREKA